MMKRFASLLLILALLLCASTASGEKWKCNGCDNITAGNYCSNCGAAKPSTWYCLQCGNTAATDAFCSKCGTKKPPVRLPARNSIEGMGYDSAREAMEAYIGYWSENDVNGMISVYAIEHYVEHFNAAEYFRQQRYFNLTVQDSSQLLSGISVLHDPECYSRAGQVAKAIRCRFLLLHWNDPDHPFDNLYSMISLKGGMIDSFLQYLDDLAKTPACTISLIGYYTPDEVTDGKYTQNYILPVLDKNGNPRSDPRSNKEKRMAIYGADDLQNIVARVQIDGKEYLQCMEFACWDGSWYALSSYNFVSALIGASGLNYGLIAADTIAK